MKVEERIVQVTWHQPGPGVIAGSLDFDALELRPGDAVYVRQVRPGERSTVARIERASWWKRQRTRLAAAIGGGMRMQRVGATVSPPDVTQGDECG